VLSADSVLDEEFWHTFTDNQCTSFAGVPHTFQVLDKAGFLQRDLPSLRYITQAGGRLKPELVSRFSTELAQRNIRFFVMYGQTEATARMAYLPPEHLQQYADCIGISIPDGTFRLINEAGQPITQKETPGELVYEGPNVMMGYAVRRADLEKGREINALYTGDIAVLNEANLYKIVGRKSRFIKPFGLRIALDEVEQLLEAQGYDAIATGHDERLAIATLDTDSTAAIQAYLSTKLSFPETAITVLPYKSYPVLPSGKMDYKAILERTDQVEQDASKPSGQPTMVLDIFRSVFNAETLLPADSFLHLSGDSLVYVSLTMKLEDHFGYLPKNWQELTIGQLEGLQIKEDKIATLNAEVVFRVAAILGVVSTHAKLYLLHGSVLLLLLLAGYNFFRFQTKHLLNGNPHLILKPIIKNIMLPYYVIAILFLVYQQDFYWPLLLLISNFFGGYAQTNSFVASYWFLEAYIQVILIFCVIFLPRKIRAFARTRPFTTGLSLFSLFLILRLTVPILWNAPHLDIRVPHMLLYVFSFGGLIYLAQSKQQKFIVTLLAFPLFFLVIGGYQGTVYTVITLVLVWTPTINLYSFTLKKLIASTAESSFYIYLFHMFPVYFIVLKEPAAEALHYKLLAVFSSLCIGLLVVRFVKPFGLNFLLSLQNRTR
jgi:hypothetical protein